MADKSFITKLIRLTLPIAFQSLMLASVAAADAIMLGRIAQNSMAAVSLATQVQFIQNMIISSITGAGMILGAQYFGKGDRKALDDIFSIMLRLSVLASFLFFAGCLFFPDYLMLIFTDVPELVQIGAGYLKIAGWSYLLTGISQCYLAMMKVTDHVFSCALISSAAVIINIFFNAVFIFGLFFVPPMDANGAAAATLISRIAELAACIIVSLRKGNIHPRPALLLRRNRLLGRDFRKCCLPLLGASLFWGIGFTSYTAIMGHMGSDAAAANSVAAVVRDLVCCACNGIAGAGGIIVGNALGAGKLSEGKSYGIRLAKLSFLNGFIALGLIAALAFPLRSSISLTEEAGDYLVGMMLITAFYMIGRCVNTVIINGVFAAGGDTIFDMYSLAVAMWGIAIPLALLGAFVFHWPVLVVYSCTCLDEVGKIPWVMLHFRKYKWVKDLTRRGV